ncbi:hypothetical protein PSECIP111951_01039 [Pseudoalteromonas holothuriae]|uniref:Flagellar hook-length control protein-like C-terminal domain-containing protein n=1 Tax=Pseudoalteromonas holothuriae TaxID=2963714 RepID=A0ABM9GFI9_9GAMM|nr:flagellar hook-length control protein FliK [Pseudoalteromonas sp. CIP111951]CAH9054452.1 hypothetical protein PSECIP111951_01039 [Pseudoalteromonas sp. CIP111951]
MNKPPISIQYSTAPDANAALSEGRTNIDLSKQSSQFVAHNVQIKSDSLQMDVEINGRWQTIRLATKNANQLPLRLNEAYITLNNNGQTLTIKSVDQVINIKAANDLLSLLTLLKGGVAESSLITNARVHTGSNPQLLLEQLGIKLALDPSLAKILHSEHKLVAQLQANENKVQLKLLNGFADQLFSSVLSKQKVAEQLAVLGKRPLILVEKHALQIKFSSQQQPLSLPISNLSSAPQIGPLKWQHAKLQTNIQGIEIKTSSEQRSIDLKQSVKGKLNQVAHIPPVRNTDTVANLHTLNYAKPMFNITLQDIKQAVEQAIGQWLTKPFKQVNKAQSALHVSQPSTNQAIVKQDALPLMLRQPPMQTQTLPPIVKLVAQLKNVLAPIIHRNTTPKDENSKLLGKNVAAQLQTPLTQPMLSSLNSNQLKTPLQTNKTHLPTDNDVSVRDNINRPLPYPTQLNSLYKASLPIERMLFEPLLKLINQSDTSALKPINNQAISEKISQLSQYKHPQSVDMSKLVHQAFSRMIDANNISASLVASELNSMVPGLVNTNTQSAPLVMANSFMQALDKLLVTLLASPKALSAQSMPESNDQSQRLNTLLETLLPNSKNVSAKQLVPHLQQLNSNLLAELSQLQNSFSSSVQLTPPTTQKIESETQLLLNLLMPMKVPAECRQTELQIGQYKKPAKAKMPEKTVWFVRLNFDYANMGKLSAHAELMDKALECEIIGNSKQVCDMAEPHLDALRRKLCAHGLQVNEIVLNEDAQQLHTFYEHHAIVNIKV